MTGWSKKIHVGFVVVSLVTTMKKRSASKTDEKGRGSSSHFQTILFFLFVASCWMTLLPLFKDSRSEANNTTATSQICFFVESISSERRKGKVADAVLAISSPRYSLVDLLAREWYKHTTVVIKSKIKGRLMREIQRALWRPFAFHGRLKKLFMVLRYAKFFAPLVGTVNKFRGHILDMIKKRRQHIASKKAQKRWNELLDALSKRSKLERAVLKFQRRFRERRET